jgi:hypothetical protein
MLTNRSAQGHEREKGVFLSAPGRPADRGMYKMIAMVCIQKVPENSINMHKL